MGINDHCCVPGCTANRKRVSNLIHFYKLPADNIRCSLWLTKIPRDWKKEGFSDPLKDVKRQNCFVCSRHFVTGKPSLDKENVDYCPSVFKEVSFPKLPTSKRDTKISSLPISFPLETPSKKRKIPVPITVPVWESDHDYLCTRSVPIDDLSPDLLSKLKTIDSLQTDNEKLRRTSVTVESIVEDPKICQRYTGFQNYPSLKGFCDYLYSRIIDGNFLRYSRVCSPKKKYNFEEELFIVLCRLKTGSYNYDFAKRFDISESSMSRLFSDWLKFLSQELKLLFELPDEAAAKHGAAPCFSKFENVTMVLDCTELFTQQPATSQNRKQVYSQYKSHNTVKFGVGMSPNLGVTFVSAAYGGHTSDTHITMQSTNLLENLKRRQGLMTDKGFCSNSITKQLELQGVQLVVPTGKGRHRSQFTEQEIQSSAECSGVRVHIERSIGRIKNFHILSSTLQLTMQDSIEDIFTVCAYLTNFQSKIIKD